MQHEDIIKVFLSSEVGYQEVYDAIMYFIESYAIRSGEYEGNEFIIKKMDQTNFFIFPEYIYEQTDYHREIHYATSLYRHDLIAAMNKWALHIGLKIKDE